MTLLSVFNIEIKQFLRDKATVIMCFIFPLALIFFLGSFLEKVDTAESAIGEIKAQYYYENLSEQSIASADAFIQGVNDNGVLKLEKAENIENGKDKVSKNDIAVLIVFKGQDLKVDVFEGSNSMANEVVNSVMSGYIQTSKAFMSVIKSGNTDFDNRKLSQQTSYTKEKDFGRKRSMMDYYAVTMLFMMAYMNIQGGSSTFVNDSKQHVLQRLRICKESRLSIYLGKLLAQLVVDVAEGVVIMLVSVIVFKVSYGPTVLSWLIVLAMFIAVSAATTLLGIVFGQIKSGKFVSGITALFWVMMFFSGTMSSRLVIDGVSEYLPPYVIQEATFDLTVFGRYGQAVTVIIVSLAITVVELFIGLKIFKKMEDER